MVTRIDWGSMRGEVDRFEQYLREVKQASENTVQSYRRDLMQMITYLEEKEIREAAKIANADSFISRLPQGYDTMLYGDGSSLSQGQQQLIAIARAAIAKPPVLILDEATSSIDTRTELQVQEAFDKLMKGRTSFIVAHRLSTIRNASLILVMKDGKIIEQGNHEELLKKGGFYHKLYHSQFES